MSRNFRLKLRSFLQLGILLVGLLNSIETHADPDAVPLTKEQQGAKWLMENRPDLLALYRRYPHLIKPLERYAINQGFTRPIELKATILHELIHIDSLVHGGYYVDGITYRRPYIGDPSWPETKVSDLIPTLTIDDKTELGSVYTLYMRNASQNGMANIEDELNAYQQVLPFVTALEPSSAKHQQRKLDQFKYLRRLFYERLPPTR
ncbi:hypothetical protein [Marinobacterium stanieri]|nr:hypothetical protein [Marinobacterium stanieri]